MPGELAFGELTGGGNRLEAECCGVDLAVEEFPGLAVADGAHRWQAGVEAVAGAQLAYFVDETSGQHGIKAFGNPLVQYAAIAHGQGNRMQLAGQGRGAGVSIAGGERSATEADDFQRTLDTLSIGRLKPGGAFGVEAGQFGVQGGPAEARGVGIDLRAQCRVGSGQVGKTVTQRLEIQHRAAGQ